MGVNQVLLGAVKIMDISDSTVTSDKMLEGVTAYDKAGDKITGTIGVQEAKTITPGTDDQIAVGAGKCTAGDIVVVGDENLVPDNIAYGVSVFGVVGTNVGVSDNYISTASGLVAHVTDALAGQKLRGLTVYGNSEQGGTPTADAPVDIVSASEVSVYVAGKNLFRHDFENFTQSVYYYVAPISLVKGATYRQSAVRAGEEINTTIGIVKAGNDYSSFVEFRPLVTVGSVTTKAAFVVDETWTGPKCVFYKSSDVTAQQVFEAYHVQLEVGVEATEWEPWVEPTVLAVDLSGHELRGLPNGVCDELAVQDGRWVYTQRVGVTATAATDGITGTVGHNVMSSTGAIEDGATVLYALDEPLTYMFNDVALPSLPSTTSNVWADSNIPCKVTIDYIYDVQEAAGQLAVALVNS